MQIHELNEKIGTLANGDLFVTDDGEDTSYVDFDDLASALISSYSGLSLAGAEQSVKDALDDLEARIATLEAALNDEDNGNEVVEGGNESS